MHKHATEMMQYAQDAAEIDAPWARWETQREGDDSWVPLNTHPQWHGQKIYRRIAERRSFGGLEWLAPMSVAPAASTEYWVFDLASGDGVFRAMWCNDETDRKYLRRGIAFATEQGAREALSVFFRVFGVFGGEE